MPNGPILILLRHAGRLAVVILFALRAAAGLQLPTNMSRSDRESALRILGVNTSPKVLSDPFPLGGYAGFEIGVSLENLPTQQIGRLGDGVPAAQQDATITKVSLGKGLYEDVDFFFSFTPYQTQKAEFTEYGGILRWCLYQGAQLPFSIALNGQMSGVNVQDKLVAQTFGLDLVSGLDVSDVGLFAGFGPVRAQGSFLGGESGVTDGDKSSQTAEVTGFHELIGASVRFRGAFIAVQVDRYSDTVLSGKFGLRF